MAENICKACGKKYDGFKNVQKFCNECGPKLTQRQRFEITHKDNPKFNIDCLNCGKKFIQRQRTAKFCCKECATAYLKATKGYNNNKTVEQTQLCWKCTKTNQFECPMFAFPMRPNPNSNAIETERGYQVTECSDFVRIPKRKRKRST